MKTKQTAVAATHVTSLTVDSARWGSADGLVDVNVVTTWHDTKAQAQNRVNGQPNTVFGKTFVEGGCLGAFKAVTWTVSQYSEVE